MSPETNKLLHMHHSKHSVVLHHSSVQECKELQRLVAVTQSIPQSRLPTIDSICTSCCFREADKIIRLVPPQSFSFSLLKSVRRYRSLKTRTTRHQLLPLASEQSFQRFGHCSIQLYLRGYKTNALQC